MTDDEIRKALESAAAAALRSEAAAARSEAAQQAHAIDDARQFGEVKGNISAVRKAVTDLDANVEATVKQMLRDAASEREQAANDRSEQILIMRDMLLSTKEQKDLFAAALDIVKVATKGQVDAAREASKPDDDPALREARTKAEISIIEARTKRDITLVSADAAETQENSALRIAEAKEKAAARKQLRERLLWAAVVLIGIAVTLIAAKLGFSAPSGGKLGNP